MLVDFLKLFYTESFCLLLLSFLQFIQGGFFPIMCFNRVVTESWEILSLRKKIISNSPVEMLTPYPPSPDLKKCKLRVLTFFL